VMYAVLAGLKRASVFPLTSLLPRSFSEPLS
jgi:hypothetical protein